MIKKKLEQVDYLSNSVIIEKHNEALSKISRLDGSLKYCSFSEIFNFMIKIIEIKNIIKFEKFLPPYNTILDIYANLSINKNYIDKGSEVTGVINAVIFGIESILEKNFLDKKIFTRLQQLIRNNKDEIRSGYGIHIVDGNKNIIYTPPQSKDEILKHLDDLEIYMNNDNKFPLIKMAISHYQFESIHPYNDGNGRTGRIINILYLMMCGVINSPFIPLSQQILKTKKEYYGLLQKVNKDENSISEFIIYILEAVSASCDEGMKLLGELDILFETINESTNIDKSLINTFLYKQLIISSKSISESMKITPYLAKKLLNRLIEENLVIQLEFNKKSKSYVLKGIMDIINKS